MVKTKDGEKSHRRSGSKRTDRSQSDDDMRFENPFAAIVNHLDLPQPSPDEEGEEKDKAAKASDGPAQKWPAKVVLRRERKGRGGKVVTILEGLSWGQQELDDLARRLRNTLGCGGKREGTQIVLQGDLGDRAEEALRKEGAHRVVRGS